MKRPLLEPFAEIFIDMRRAIFDKVNAMDERELKKIEGALEKLTTSNCAWTMHAAAKHVQDAINHRRAHKFVAKKSNTGTRLR